MNYILECDSFNPIKLVAWLNGQQNNNVYYILHKKHSRSKFQGLFDNCSNAIAIIYEDIFSFSSHSHLIEVDLESFSKYYFKDGISFFLLDRDGYFPDHGQGNHNAMVYYLSRVPHIVDFLKCKDIQCIYFRNTPHISNEWLVAQCANYCEIDVIVSQRHVLPWRYSLAKGFGRYRKLFNFESNNSHDQNSVEINHIREFINLNSKEYDIAIPSYEKLRMGNNKNRLMNPFRQWREIIYRSPNYYLKYLSYKRYNSLSRELDLKMRFVTFFLHYQPERTTLPEGFGFNNQLLAITELRNSLPPDVFIYVKEHPSMFTNNWNPKARNEQFYSMVLELPNVALAKLTQNTFELIDNAIAIATITGTVGVQSYIRQTPVIYFGFSVFRAVGVHVYKNLKDLKAFVDLLIKGEIVIENVESGLMNTLTGSLSGLPQDLDGEIDYHAAKEYQEDAHFKLLSKYFSHS